MERLLIVGNPLPFHIGAYLERAAQNLGLEVQICDTQTAFATSRWLNRLSWYLFGKRPYHLRAFSAHIVQQCERFRPKWLLVTGIAPVDAPSLQAIGALGIKRLNYLTDDPWNPAHQAEWFLQALRHYDHIFSPRRATMEDLRQNSQALVHYLPFGYAPHIHFIPNNVHDAMMDNDTPDVVFVGGGDNDRSALFAEAIDLGLRPALYGGYWARYPNFRPYQYGHIGPDKLREKTAVAINLCLVRRANRDGHVMRSFEIPACGGAMIAEDTEEHRAIFGAEGAAVLYFSSVAELVAKTNQVAADKALRQHLRRSAHTLIHQGKHTYQDRLMTMVKHHAGT